MSLFSVQQNNDLRIRAQNIYGENFFIKDSPTDSWVPLKPGGASPSVELPYYIKPAEIEMDNGIGKGLVIDPTGVTFGDDAGNKKIDATFVRNVEDLDTQVDANTVAVGNLMPRMTAVENINTTQDTNITALQTKTANITQGASMLNLGYVSTTSNRAAITNSGLMVYNGTSAAGSFPQVKISPTYIHFFKSLDTSVFLDYDRVDNVAKLASVSTIDFNDKLNLTKGVTLPGAVESVSTTNKKMVVMDATTKALSYATIPSAGGSALPYWVKPTSASLANSTHSITVAPTDISFYRTDGNGNGEVFLLDYDTLRLIYDRSTRTNNWQETRWTAPDYATMGGTAPAAVVDYEIKNFNKPLHFFSEMHRPGDILWVNLLAWNASVGTSDGSSRGILLSFKAFEYSENHTWEISYSGNDITVSKQEVDVFNTGPESRRSLFISFKANSGTVNVNGWLKIKLGNSFKTPVYPGVGVASPTSEIRP